MNPRGYVSPSYFAVKREDLQQIYDRLSTARYDYVADGWTCVDCGADSESGCTAACEYVLLLDKLRQLLGEEKQK